MSNTIRVVTPNDIGNTITLGSDNKYNVNVEALDLPASITSVSLSDKTLTISTNKGDKTVDLTPLVPEVVADVFLKSVTRQDNQIVFTVGNKKDSDADTALQIDVSDLLPVQVGNTLTGNGTQGSPLGIKISASTDNNLLKSTDDGIYVSTADIQALIPQVNRDVRLVNASGETEVGFIYSTEQ